MVSGRPRRGALFVSSGARSGRAHRARPALPGWRGMPQARRARPVRLRARARSLHLRPRVRSRRPPRSTRASSGSLVGPTANTARSAWSPAAKRAEAVTHADGRCASHGRDLDQGPRRDPRLGLMQGPHLAEKVEVGVAGGRVRSHPHRDSGGKQRRDEWRRVVQVEVGARARHRSADCGRESRDVAVFELAQVHGGRAVEHAQTAQIGHGPDPGGRESVRRYAMRRARAGRYRGASARTRRPIPRRGWRPGHRTAPPCRAPRGAGPDPRCTASGARARARRAHRTRLATSG